MIRDYTKNDVCTFQKYLLISTFLLFSVNSFILLVTPPESGYEPSIYGAYPLIFWIFMIICIIFSILNIVLSVSFDSNKWMYNLLPIFLCYTFLLFLPVIRGYEFFGSPSYDIFAHLAIISKIIDSGYLPGGLFYPIIHILAVILFYVGLPLRLVSSFISTIFLLLYVLFLYMLGKYFFKNKPNSRFLLIFSLPMMFSFFHYAFIPFFFAVSALPLFLYCFHKRDSNNEIAFTILTLLLAIFIVFTHPLVSLFLIIFLILYQVLLLVKRNNTFITSDHNPIFLSGISNMIIIVAVSFLAWYLNFRSILKMFSTVIDALFDQGQNTILSSQMGVVQSSNASMLDITEIIIKLYGPILIFLFIASFGFIFILNKLRSKSVEELDVLYGFQFLVSLLFGLSMIIGYFIVFELIRALSFAITMSTILCGIIFGKLHENTDSKKRKKWINVFVVIIICSSSVMGIFNIYESPWIKQASPSMDTMMKNGLDWFLTSKNESIPLTSDFKSIYKYEMYHPQFNNNQKYTIMDNTSIPSHFGYDTNNTLLVSLGYNPKYLIIYEYMIQKYKYVLQSQQYKYSIYSKNDFQKLSNDSTVNKLYMNGEFELWNIPVYNNNSKIIKK